MRKYLFELRQVTEEHPQEMFRSFREAMWHGGIRDNCYRITDAGRVWAKSPEEACEKLFCRYNKGQFDPDYEGRSMSVSDVVWLWDAEGGAQVLTKWYCDSIGFREITEVETSV